MKIAMDNQQLINHIHKYSNVTNGTYRAGECVMHRWQLARSGESAQKIRTRRRRARI